MQCIYLAHPVHSMIIAMVYTTTIIIIIIIVVVVTLVVIVYSCNLLLHQLLSCYAGQPQEETQFSYVPPSAALQVYSCGVLITIGAALCFSSRQRHHLQSVRNEDVNHQFIQQGKPADNSSTAADDQDLIQPLLPESAV